MKRNIIVVNSSFPMKRPGLYNTTDQENIETFKKGGQKWRERKEKEQKLKKGKGEAKIGDGGKKENEGKDAEKRDRCTE
jgi:hypothetical protein